MVAVPHFYTLFAPGAATAPKVCRDFVRSALAASGLGHLADTAAFCVSELTTNVHVHTQSDIHLQLAVEPTHVRVGVYDRSPSLPAPRRARLTETNGRGLFLVTALSDACGMCNGGTDTQKGKEVWFELRTGTAA